VVKELQRLDNMLIGHSFNQAWHRVVICRKRSVVEVGVDLGRHLLLRRYPRNRICGVI